MQVIDRYIAVIKDSKDEYLHERYVDLVDIKSRMLTNFMNIKISLANLDESILYLEELLPSLLVGISPKIKGIIAKKGGLTSHSAIVCRSLGIPYVVCDLGDAPKGVTVIDNNKVILNPNEEEIFLYRNRHITEEVIKCDISPLELWANVKDNNDIKMVGKEFKGIGLYRTEFLLMDEAVAFNVKLQANLYLEACLKMEGRPITFRTFDIGDDKMFSFLPNAVKGTDNYFIYPKLFEIQIEALLIASNKYPKQVRIMLPMIESFEAYQNLKKIIIKKAREMHVKCPKVGMMLETQRALINLESFNKVDFISVGTNDLTLELFNIKRDSLLLFDDIYESLAQVVIKVIEFSKRTNVPLCVCGELASNEAFAGRLIDAGIENLSITPNQINAIYKAKKETMKNA